MSKDRLRWAAIGLALGIIGGGVGAAGANRWYPGVTRFETIRAQEIQIVNTGGKLAAMIRSDSDGGTLSVLNTAGEPVVMLFADSDGSGKLSVCNAAREPVAGIGADSDGGGLLSVTNAAGKPAAALGTHKNGAVLELYNAAGNLVAKLPAGESGGTK